jgi:hypothetical protein
MQYRWIVWAFWCLVAASGWGGADFSGPFPAGQDLHLVAPLMIIPEGLPADGRTRLILDQGTTISIGDHQIASDRAVVLLTPRGESITGLEGKFYEALLYLEGNVSLTQGAKSRATVFNKGVVENAGSMAVRFLVTGQVFVTADMQQRLPIDAFGNQSPYPQALAAFSQMRLGPSIEPTAYVPAIEDRFLSPKAMAAEKKPGAAPGPAAAEPSAPTEPIDDYPIHINALWEPAPEVEKRTLPDGREAATISGRFYLWQKRTEETLLEFLADSAVVYYSGRQFTDNPPDASGNEIASGKIEAVYLSGNIVMTEGQITIRADQIYYDFIRHQALIVNAEMQTFSPARSLPVYIQAEKLRRISDNLFDGQNVRLTDSEFYLPQISVQAARMVLLTSRQIEDRRRQIEEGSAAAQGQTMGTFEDVSFRYGRHSLWRWPKVQTNFMRPDFPLNRLRIGNDNEFGTTVETRWNLARVLGMADSEGVDGELLMDYYSDRGVGAGLETEYDRPDSFGSLLAYVMSYRGKDDLGRKGDDRRNLDPEQDTRGRFSWRHRLFLPDDWQMTIEVGYLSDRYFQEWMYRSEYYNDKPQETLVQLKRLKDNWAFSILGKVRINDFEDTIEELPTAEFHWKGASFWDHRFTFYSDTQAGRLRNRFDEDNPVHATSEDFYTMASTRNEVDLPLGWKSLKVVPFAAATYAFEDHDEFNTALDGSLVEPEDQPFLGEYGLRASTMFWKQDDSFRSRLWDLDGIRHLVTPHFEAVFYEDNSQTVSMRDMYNAGLSQRWQTHRGPEGRKRTVDWLRWDLDATWADDSAAASIDPFGRYGPAAFLFNDSAIPLRTRRGTPFYGLVRDSLNSDLEWKVSDTMAVLSDLNYDLHSGNLQQLDVGVSRYVYPDLSYYVGSRYLRPVIVEIPEDHIYEEGSHSLVTAITYALSPRYTATFAQEYNFDYGQSVRSELSIIRRYHRLFYGFNISLDESLGRQSVSLSVWPQGIQELTVGRRYIGMTETIREY